MVERFRGYLSQELGELDPGPAISHSRTPSFQSDADISVVQVSSMDKKNTGIALDAVVNLLARVFIMMLPDNELYAKLMPLPTDRSQGKVTRTSGNVDSNHDNWCSERCYFS